jgi:hypothetical protein
MQRFSQTLGAPRAAQYWAERTTLAQNAANVLHSVVFALRARRRRATQTV